MSDERNKLKRTRELTRLRVKKFRENQRIEIASNLQSTSTSYEQIEIASNPPSTSMSYEQFAADRHVTVESDHTDNSEEFSRSHKSDKNVLEEARIHLEESENESILNESISDELSKSNASLSEAINEKLLAENDKLDNDKKVDNKNNDEEFDTIEEIRQWALLDPPIPHARLELLLNILRRDHPSLPKSAKTFLSTTSIEYTIENIDEINDHEFVYFSIYHNLLRCINLNLHDGNKIELLINVDGLPLFKSSSKQLWPILCKIFHNPDLYKPFPIAIYCGNNKPRNVFNYLKKFINEINHIQRSGITVNNRQFYVSIKAFICDRPARAFLKCIIGHGGYWACERCTVKGIRENNRIIYPVTDDVELRTDMSFRIQSNTEHHISVSPLLNIEPPIDLINQFPLDSMHLVYLGVMKKLFAYWLNSNLKNVRLSNNAKTQLSNLLIQIQKQIPSEFQRTTRSLSDINKFKATEFQFILLYAGPIIFKKILPKDIYRHFLLLHVGCRLLSSKDLALQKSEHAKYVLTQFVTIAPKLYGKECLISNMHGLIHIADDVQYMNCPISNITAYPFESALGKLKKLIRHGNKPLSQLCRRLNEVLSLVDEKNSALSSVKILRKLCMDINSGKFPIKRIQFKNTLLTDKVPNNTVLLNNNKIFQITNISIPHNEDEQSIEIMGIILQKIEPLYLYPCNAKIMKMWRVSIKHSSISTYKLFDVQLKMLLINISNERKEKMYVLPLLHM